MTALRLEQGNSIWQEPAPLRGVAHLGCYPWLVVGTVCIGAFMGQLDASIAQLVLPEVEQDFHVSIGAAAWVSIAYLLVAAAMLPVFGRLADMFGRKLLYCGGFVVFVTGSALCGLAPSLGTLVAARVLQALGAGLLQANAIAIIVAAAAERRRGRALGLQSAAQAVGLSAGPALGGFLIAVLGWRWVFWINLPVGLLGAVLGLLVLPRTERPHGTTVPSTATFDFAGAVLLVPSLGLLMFALNEAGHAGFRSPLLIGPLLVGLLLLIGFVRREQRTRSPLIDLRLFRNAVFVAGNVAGLLSYATLFGAFFVLPFVLEQAYGDSSFTAGLRLSVIPVALGLVAPLSGALYDRLGAKFLTVSGMVAALVGLLAVSFALEDGRLILATTSLALFGIGQGLFTAPNNSAIMASAATGQSGQAGGVLFVMRSLGMSLGISLASIILAWRFPMQPGRPQATIGIPAHVLVHGAVASFMVLAALAGLAALLCFVRAERRAADGRTSFVELAE
jgi:EmrB/QacA subfamily drug resistance transporter